MLEKKRVGWIADENGIALFIGGPPWSPWLSVKPNVYIFYWTNIIQSKSLKASILKTKISKYKGANLLYLGLVNIAQEQCCFNRLTHLVVLTF